MTATEVPGRVSIVVLNWNSGRLGAAATASALAQEWDDLEVIVVDNGSVDDSLATIETAHPEAIVVRNEENLGFSGGMNTGIAAATGEYVLPLNCDAELDPGYVPTLVEVLAASPRLAAAGGRVESPRVGASGPLRITATMRTAPLPLDAEIDCDKLNGACPLFRAAALHQVEQRFGGPYDARYFTYGEDIDLALTLRRLGWRFRYVPTATAHHVRSYGSAPRLADRVGPLRVSTLRNRHRNIVRHTPNRWWLVTLFAAAQDAGFAVLRTLRGDVRAGVDVMRAWWAVLGGLGVDRRKRHALPLPDGV